MWGIWGPHTPPGTMRMVLARDLLFNRLQETLPALVLVVLGLPLVPFYRLFARHDAVDGAFQPHLDP